MSVNSFFRSVRGLQEKIQRLGMGQPAVPKVTPGSVDFVGLYDILVKSEPLRHATRKLFSDGHYARAVEDAYKCLNNTVKSKAGLSLDGKDLMESVFSLKNPTLKLNLLKTQSEKDAQLGYMLCLSGSMVGIRNPRAHEHDLADTPEIALEMLVWANHLMCVVDKAKRVRRHKKTSKP